MKCPDCQIEYPPGGHRPGSGACLLRRIDNLKDSLEYLRSECNGLYKELGETRHSLETLREAFRQELAHSMEIACRLERLLGIAKEVPK